MGHLESRSSVLSSKLEVLADLEETVRQFIAKHEEKRELWYPSEFLPANPDDLNDSVITELRDRARGLPRFCTRRVHDQYPHRRRPPPFSPPYRGGTRDKDVLGSLEQALDGGGRPARQHPPGLRPRRAVPEFLRPRGTPVQIHPERLLPAVGRRPVQALHLHDVPGARNADLASQHGETRRRAGAPPRRGHAEDRAGRVTPLRVLHERFPRDPRARPQPGA